MSLIAVAEATVPTFNEVLAEPIAEASEVSTNSTVPAAASLTIFAPFNLVGPANTTSAASAECPASTFPAGSPTAVIEVIVLKYLLLAQPNFLEFLQL